MTEIIAEISGNHGGLLKNAIELIDAAAYAGADTVKFQCFEIEQLARKRFGVIWEKKGLGHNELMALYTKTHTPKTWFPSLINAANSHGLNWFSSVFHPDDVRFLETLGCPRYKISAYEIMALDGDLINAVKATGKPVLFSVRQTETVKVMIATDYEGHIAPLGLSDHSQTGTIVPAKIPFVERHIMLDGVETPDRAFSSTGRDFKRWVGIIRKNPG